MSAEYVIYCDESAKKGKFYSNFYGGALVSSSSIDMVREELSKAKANFGLGGEIKWSKISASYADKYIGALSVFFDLIKGGHVKIRIMFTRNNVIPLRLKSEHIEDEYFILYYHFLREAFGLTYCPFYDSGTKIRIYLDMIPDNEERSEKFKSFVVRMSNTYRFRLNRLSIVREDVTEVISHEHDILQFVDVILGSMNFRLNDLHKEKPEGALRRGNRTLAKEKVYNHINKKIREIYPNFNIGMTTGVRGNTCNRWNDPYRHWLFMPKERQIIPGSKRKK